MSNDLPTPAPSDPGDVAVLPPTVDRRPAAATDDVGLQLRRLGELREQEIKRHELVVAELQAHVRRHTRAARLLVLISLGLLALVAMLALAMNRLRADQVRTVAAVNAAGAEILRLQGAVLEATRQTAAQYEGMSAGLASNVQKLDAVRPEFEATIGGAVQALRQERDAIFGGVRLAMEDQNQRIVEREIVLRQQEQELQRERQRVREERHRIIQDAIQKLSSLNQEPPPAKPEP